MAHTGEVRALWIVVVAACGSPDEVTLRDAAEEGPLTYTLATSWTNGFGAPAVAPKPTVYIDGIQTTQLVFDYASNADAIAASHIIELRHGDLVVFSATSSAPHRGCLTSDLFPRPAVSASETWCAFDYGELRYQSGQTQTASSACVADGFCIPACTLASCAPGQRCSSIYASIDPIATHLGCVPVGTKALGEQCGFVTDASGTHDDCGVALLCVEDQCKRVCDPGREPTNGCGVCSYALGHAAEIGVCN